ERRDIARRLVLELVALHLRHDLVDGLVVLEREVRVAKLDFLRELLHFTLVTKLVVLATDLKLLLLERDLRRRLRRILLDVLGVLFVRHNELRSVAEAERREYLIRNLRRLHALGNARQRAD